MSNTAPKTYSEAIKVAEPITAEEFDNLLANCRGDVTVFEKKCPRKHVYDIHFLKLTEGRVSNRTLWITYGSPRSGYEKGSSVYLSNWQPPVFDFYNQGRIVRVVGEEVAA